MLTKSTDWQSVEKARKQGNFASGKICRRRRLDLTIPKGSANPPKEAKIASDFHFIRTIFAVVGFVSALGAPFPFWERDAQDVDKVNRLAER